VFVTHDQDEALTLSDRLAVFHNGRIEQVGAAREVYENPVNRFVADFVGTSNVLDGATAQTLLGRTGTYAIRPERMVLLDDGADVPAGMRSVPARVAEVVYAGPVTRVAADTESGQRLNATLVSARTGSDIAHDAPIVLAWPDDAVCPLAPAP
jgi:putative spermidine/putrescine transport system ATP-binding protein